MFEPLSTPKDALSDNALLMKKVAEGAPLDKLEVNGDELLSRTKLFLVTQACNELNRVIKMTEFLDNLESKFMDVVNAKLEQTPENLQLISYAMETITNSLARSNNIITQVLKDDKLSSIIINTTNVITADGNSSTIMDMNSRDAVRNMASSLLDELSRVVADSGDVIDVDIEESGDTNGDNESKS